MGRQGTSEQQSDCKQSKRVRFDMTSVEKADVAEPAEPLDAVP